MSTITDFETFFKKATDFEPYNFQKRFADENEFPDIINIPTGLGKTECVILGWIWKKINEEQHLLSNEIPRRLVYVLPMRTLVEQIYDKTKEWLERLNINNNFTLVKIIGGETNDNWDIYPEKNTILIGTQDMLLSRGLNRGYGMSRFRWPIEFGLLNNDSLWIFDEIQLMGSGVKTSVQLESFRKIFGVEKPTKTIWMSATVNSDWLETVDSHVLGEKVTMGLTKEDLDNERIKSLIKAEKKLTLKEIDKFEQKEMEEIASDVIKKHKDGTKTFVIMNTVKKAIEIFSEISKILDKSNLSIPIILIHSQFREEDRKQRINKLFNERNSIVVSTQVIEAGIDVSCNTLFTEIAPWNSLIQRFGRCNRYGESNDAEITVIYESKNIKNVLPYSEIELNESLRTLESIKEGILTIESIPKIGMHINPDEHVLREKDITELFDTTKDISGGDIDISVFVRDNKDFNVQVFWREIAEESNNTINEQSFPARDELCNAPISDVRELVKEKKSLWDKDWYEGNWVRIKEQAKVIPGKTIMISSAEGCYSSTNGWDIKSKTKVLPVNNSSQEDDFSYVDDFSSDGDWKSIEQHSNEVVNKVNEILYKLSLSKEKENYIIKGSRWHDAGKAHPAFQAKIKKDRFPGKDIPLLAKAPKDAWYDSSEKNSSQNYRKYFRHELASGLLAIQNGEPDIVSYLAMSHHGKVRASIRSMPNEMIPHDQKRRFARGVWDDDIIPEINLGDGIIVPESKINLDLMEIGGGTMGKSWVSRVSEMCDDKNLGIFRLSYLESIVRAADKRASGGLP